MRTTEGQLGRAGRTTADGIDVPAGPHPRRSRGVGAVRWASVVASATCLTLTAGVPGAVADDHDGSEVATRDSSTPSAADVRAAEARAAEAATDVAGVQAELARAAAELEAASLVAEQAAESYNAARWRLDEATETVRRARAAERRVREQIAAQRDRLAAMVAQSYEGSGDLSAVDAVAGTSDPASMMSQLLTFDGASAAMDATLQRYAAGATLASVFEERAEQARERRVSLLQEAASARTTAAAAAAQAEATASAVAERRTALLARMASLQGISVDLAERRQTAVEERRRREAARAAARAAAQAAREAAARDAAPEDSAEQPTPGAAADPAPAPAPEPAPEPAPAPTPAPSPPPAAAPPPPVAPEPSGGVAAAVAFAKAQIGDPYVWAAAGPDAWDCSGLTMAAWAAAGVSLPHYSVAQYDVATPISARELRPGDLLFWSANGSPSGIHHVALYVGDGMMVHAPRTGRLVSLEPMSYWPPNLFGRI